MLTMNVAIYSNSIAKIVAIAFIMDSSCNAVAFSHCYYQATVCTHP